MSKRKRAAPKIRREYYRYHPEGGGLIERVPPPELSSNNLKISDEEDEPLCWSKLVKDKNTELICWYDRAEDRQRVQIRMTDLYLHKFASHIFENCKCGHPDSEHTANCESKK